MASEYQINGRDLDDPQNRWRVMDGTLIPSLGVPVNVATVVPGRAGVLPYPTDQFGTFLVTVNVMVQDYLGAERKGRAQLDANWNALQSRIMHWGRLMQMRYQPVNGEARLARVRLGSVAQPVYSHGALIIETQIIFEGVDGFWTGEAVHTVDGADLSALQGTPRAITAGEYLLKMSKDTAMVKDTVSESIMSVSGSFWRDGWIRVDPRNYRAVLVPTASWTDAGTDVSASLSVSSGGFRLTPDADGLPSLTAYNCGVTVRAAKEY